MLIFLTLLTKLLPLYFIMFLGFLASRLLWAQKATIASLLIYIISPVIIFYGTYSAELNMSVILLPLFFFLLACGISLLFLWIWSLAFPGTKLKNILAFTSGTGNTGYFGLPVVLILFDESLFSIAVLCILGFVLYENTLGYFLTSKWHFTTRQSLLKVLKLPTIYAFTLWLLGNYFQVPLGQEIVTNILNFRWAYVVLGMLIIGMGLAGIQKTSFHFNFIATTFFAKFVVWPASILCFIYLDRVFFWLFTQEIYSIMILMSLVPLAANTIAVATELWVHPEEAAISVFLSTLFALVYIPFMVYMLL